MCSNCHIHVVKIVSLLLRVLIITFVIVIFTIPVLVHLSFPSVVSLPLCYYSCSCVLLLVFLVVLFCSCFSSWLPVVLHYHFVLCYFVMFDALPLVRVRMHLDVCLIRRLCVLFVFSCYGPCLLLFVLFVLFVSS